MYRYAPIAVLALLLLAAASAQGRVIQANDAKSPAPGERGGQALPRGVTGPGCAEVMAIRCPAAFAFGPFGWLSPQEMEIVARVNANTRAALASERAVWRSPRVAGRPGFGKRLLRLPRPLHLPLP